VRSLLDLALAAVALVWMSGGVLLFIFDQVSPLWMLLAVAAVLAVIDTYVLIYIIRKIRSARTGAQPEKEHHP
jgi:membrane protein implicated in regulation of membrane protease activity